MHGDPTRLTTLADRAPDRDLLEYEPILADHIRHGEASDLGDTQSGINGQPEFQEIGERIVRLRKNIALDLLYLLI